MSRVSYCYAALLLLGLGVASICAIEDIGWWKNTPFYQIYPRSFKDSDKDGIGDLQGITSKLEHFNDAGIGAIWLSPIYESPMKDFGYDISNFTRIQPDYGTMADFEALTAEAKKLNLKVILDLVPNHASDQHEWFKKSVKKIDPYTHYFVWREGKNATTPPNNWISVFGKSAWTYNEERGEWYFHQFLAEQPDLDYTNPKVQLEMQEVILFWLDKGVDGFRVDAVPHLFEVADLRDEPLSGNPSAEPDEYTYLDHIYTKDQPETYELVKSWREILDKYANWSKSHERVMMTEAYTGLNKTVEFYDAGAHVPFNFKFITDVNSTSKPSEFKKLIDDWMRESDSRNAVANWVMGNHDRKRTETRYPDRGDSMIMLEMILPGVSVTYYGEEIGMVDKSDITYAETQDPQGCLAGPDRYQLVSRDPCRTPFQWTGAAWAGFTEGNSTWIPIQQTYTTNNLEAQKSANKSHFKIFQSLTKLKTESPTLANGTLKVVTHDNDKVLTIVRGSLDENEVVLLVMNFVNATTKVDVSDQIPSNIAYNGTIVVASLNSQLEQGTTIDLKEVTLSPNAAVVIRANNNRTISADGANHSDNNSISFIKATFILIATLLITYR